MFNDQSDLSMPGHYTPAQTVLLLLDFHVAFIEKAGRETAHAAASVAVQMHQWARSKGIHVIHCLIDFDSTPYPTSKDFARLSAISSAMKLSGSEEHSMFLENSDGDVTFTRTVGHVSALKSPGLKEYLEQKEITSLLVTGLTTSGCVLRTALMACDEEYVVTVISDGCADAKQNVHDVAIRDIIPTRGYTCTAEEFMRDYDKIFGSR